MKVAIAASIIIVITFILNRVDTCLQKISSKYKATRFYEDCRALYIPGNAEVKRSLQDCG